jgi:hypothetical protein
MRSLLLLAMAAAPLAAQPAAKLPPVAEQVAAATLPLTADLRAGATVMGYREPGKLVVLRDG